MKKSLKLIFSLGVAVLLAFSVSLTALASGSEVITDTEAVSTEAEDSQNLFEEAYETVLQHSSELFSALAFLGTLVIAFCYKKGLLPILTSALKSLGESVKTLCEGSKENLEQANEGVAEISERLARLENAVEIFTADITTLEESLGTEAQVRADARAQKKILLAQIEMLKEVFICSALPQYQKDAISEKVKLMKEELEVYEESGE